MNDERRASCGGTIRAMGKTDWCVRCPAVPAMLRRERRRGYKKGTASSMLPCCGVARSLRWGFVAILQACRTGTHGLARIRLSPQVHRRRSLSAAISQRFLHPGRSWCTGVPRVFKPALGGVSRWLRLYGHTEDIAALASGWEARHEALASGYDPALCF
jgi:hypothetical protein